MPSLGKEVERQLTSDELALREVQGYIDRIERQAEQKDQPVDKQQVEVVQTPVVQSAGGQQSVPLGPPIKDKKIVLPLDQVELERGLSKNVTEAIRWLSEWCVMMIKKYPGRVFYMSKTAN